MYFWVKLYPFFRCILYAMESVHFEKSQKSLSGHEIKKVMSRAPILSAYREAGFIDTFPLHDDEEIDKLGKMWVKGGLFRPPVQVKETSIDEVF